MSKVSWLRKATSNAPRTPDGRRILVLAGSFREANYYAKEEKWPQGWKFISNPHDLYGHRPENAVLLLRGRYFDHPLWPELWEIVQWQGLDDTPEIEQMSWEDLEEQ